MVSRGNQYMALDEGSVVGYDAKEWCLFKNICSDTIALAEVTFGMVCWIGIPGGLAPVLHADYSLPGRMCCLWLKYSVPGLIYATNKQAFSVIYYLMRACR